MTTNKKLCVVLAIIAVIAVAITAYCFIYNTTEKSSDKTVNIPVEKLTDSKSIQLELGTNKQNAQEIATQVQEVQQGKKKPVATFTDPSTSPEKAVESVIERIEYKDTTLPKEATKNTDKTVVTTNTDGTKVDVYKINTYRNWEAGVGIGKLDDKTYIPVALQRNYDRCHSIELQANLDTNGHVDGGQVMWKVHF